MRTKTILAATFVIPLLVLACNRDEQSPTASANPNSVENQSMASSPDKIIENAPPAAGSPTSPAPDMQATPASPLGKPSASDSSAANQQSAPANK